MNYEETLRNPFLELSKKILNEYGTSITHFTLNLSDEILKLNVQTKNNEDTMKIRYDSKICNGKLYIKIQNIIQIQKIEHESSNINCEELQTVLNSMTEGILEKNLNEIKSFLEKFEQFRKI